MRLDKEDGVSLTLWIASAAARKIGVEMAAEFFRRSAGVRVGIVIDASMLPVHGWRSG